MAREWETLTEAQQEALNDEAHATACDYLRAAGGDRKAAYDQFRADQAEYQRLAREGSKARASKREKASAEYATERLERLALVEGFIWDAEI